MDNNIAQDIRRYGEKIIGSEIFEQAKYAGHHNGTISIAAHSVHVAESSLRLGYVLKRIGLHPNMEDIVISSLCHDLSLINESYKTGWKCCQNHGKDSVKETEKIIGEVSSSVDNAISRHMFPLVIKPPTSIEGVILTITDKYVTMKDLMLRITNKRAA